MDVNTLYYDDQDGSTRVYERSDTGRSDRHPVFEYVSDQERSDGYPMIATVDDFDTYLVRLLSVVPLPTRDQPTLTFREALASLPHQALWRHFQVDGDGEWIRRGLINGTIVMVHDGSYMAKVDPHVCSAGYVIKCTRTGFRAVGSVVEHSANADNYRAEALGSIVGQLVLRAASQRHFRYKSCEAYCDNKGIVNHANDCDSPLKEKQSQADVIALVKQYSRDLPFRVQYKHVFGHLDDVLRWDQLSDVQQLNVEMDTLAKKALLAALVNREFIDAEFPFEPFHFSCGDRKVRSSPTEAIYAWWGSIVARKYYHGKKKIHKDHFDLIYGRGMGKVMQRFPIMFRKWVAKHVSGCCGVRRYLSKWDKSVKNVCPTCAARNEDTAHITLCRDPHRVKVYRRSIRSLEAWMVKNQTDPVLIEMIREYLSDRGDSSMTSLLDSRWASRYALLAQYHDKLGWQNFVEGRYVSLYVEYQRMYLNTLDTYRTAETWATGLIEQLLRITHDQWLHRNNLMHFKRKGGVTVAEYAKIESTVKDLIWTDPDELLEDDRALLRENFYKLGKSSPTNQRYWISSMEAAIQAASHHRKRTRGVRDSEEPAEAVHGGDPEVDTEGSQRYRSRRKKS